MIIVRIAFQISILIPKLIYLFVRILVGMHCAKRAFHAELKLSQLGESDIETLMNDYRLIRRKNLKTAFQAFNTRDRKTDIQS